MGNPNPSPATRFNGSRPNPQAPRPVGRSAGTRDTLSKNFIKDFVAVWDRLGRKAIETVAETDPSTFVRVGASMLPKEFVVTTPESKLTDEQIDQYYEVLAQRLAAKAQRAEAQLAATPTPTEAVN